MKTITHAQYLQLIGLREICRQQWKMCQAAIAAAAEITGELDEYGNLETSGHTSDMMFDSRDLNEGLQLLKVTVESVPAAPEPSDG